MTREMEERIVAMYFDNEDFEKNAKTTIETLGQLKSGLDLKDSAKGFEVFEKLGKTLNFEKAQKGLNKIKTTLTGMSGIFKKVFNLGPLDEAAAAVMHFKNTYLDRVLGFDLANTIARSLENAFRGLTIQPISAGWTQYQNKMDSVKTIMSSTGESIETVETHLQSLTEYANKTIYSLSDMTSNLGKFTNNGMKLKDSVLAMQGIANAAADAGQGAQQASMAMYNFSQAMGVGKMTTIDWKSIENANMATTRLKDTFIEMAAAQGELHKEFSETDKKYHYFITKNSKGQAEKDRKKWTEVTAKNFRETLSKDWLTAEAMIHALMVYSGEALDPDTIKSWGITDPKLIKDLEEIGKNALEAATQVRTFSKMMDAAKEAAQSGWADSFELIFGNMEQGTTLWTDLNGVLDEILSKSAETRNNMLQIWAGSSESTKEEEEEVKSKTETLAVLKANLEQMQKETDIAGTAAEIDKLRASVQKYKEEIQELRANKTKDNAASTQAQIDRRLSKIDELNKQIDELEKRNRKNTANQKKLTRISELEEQISAYQQEIQALNHAAEIDSESDADTSAKRQQAITEKEKKMSQLQQELDKLRKETGTDEIEATKKQIEELEKEIEQLNAVIDEKNSKQKSEFVDEQGRSGRDILFDRETGALFQMIDLAREFGTTFSEAFGAAFGVVDAEKLFNMTKDFGNAVKTVVEWFGKANEEGSRMNKIKKGLQGIFAILKTVVNFIKIGWNLVKKIIAPISDFLIDKFAKFGEFFGNLGELKPVEVFQKIGEGLSKTWEKVKKFFSPQEIKDASGKGTGVKEIPVITWLKEVWAGLKSTVKQWASDNGLGDIYTNVSTWWHNLTTSIDEAFVEIKTWWEGTTISTFFDNMWNSIVHAFTPEEVGVDEKGNTIYGDSPIVKFFKNIGTDIDNAFNDVKDWWNDSKIPKFFSDMWDKITGLFSSKLDFVTYDDKGRHEHYTKSPIVQFFLDIKDSVGRAFKTVEQWWNDSGIPDFFSGMWDGITGLFKGEETKDANGNVTYGDSPIVKFFKEIGGAVDTAFANVKEWWEGSPIPGFFENMWTTITNWFKDEKVGTDENGNDIYRSPIVQFFYNVWDGIKEAYEGLSNWWYNESGIPKFFSDMWNEITGVFKPKLDFVTYDSTGRHEHYQKAPIVTWLEDIWSKVKSVWDGIVGWEGWTAIGEFLSNTWNWIVGLFAGSSKSTAGASKDAVESVGEIVDAANSANMTPEETKEGLNFFQQIMATLGDFIKNVAEAVNGVVIPPEVSAFLEKVWSFLTGVLQKIGDVLGSFGKWFKEGWASEGWTSEDTWNIILTILGGIGLLVTNLMAAKWTSGLSAVNNIGTQFLMFGGGLLMIASAISLLTTIDQAKMFDAAKVLAGLALAVGVVLYAVGSVNKTINEVKTTAVERFFGNLINKGAMLGALYIITSSIPSIITAVSEAKKSGITDLGDDILKIAEGMSLLFGSVVLTMGIINAIAPQGISPAAALKTALSVAAVAATMVGVLKVLGGIPELIGEAVAGNGQVGVDQAIKQIQNGGKILTALGVALGESLGAVVGAFTGGMTEGAMITAADGIAAATTILSDISSEDLGKFSVMLGYMVEIYKEFGKVDFSQTLDTLLNGDKLKRFGSSMGEIAEGMGAFMTKLRGYTDDDMNKMRDSFRFLAYFGNAMELLEHAVFGKRVNPGFVTKSAMFQEYMDAAELLAEAVKQGLVNEDGSMTGLEFNAWPIIDAICKALLNGKLAIANAVKEMVNSGMEAVDDGDNTSRNRIKVPENVLNTYSELMDKYQTDNGGTFDINDMLTELIGDEGTFNQLMSQFDSKTEELGTKWDSLTSVFDGADFTKFKMFDTETGEEKETDMLTYFQEELGKLSQALDETGPLEVTITPVFDMKNMTPEKLQEALDRRFMDDPLLARVHLSNPASEINLSTLKTDLGIDQLDLKLGALLIALTAADRNNSIAIGDLGSNMTSIANAIASMKLMLDTGVLVGQITPMVDYELGRRSSLYSRTGVTFGKK